MRFCFTPGNLLRRQTKKDYRGFRFSGPGKTVPDQFPATLWRGPPVNSSNDQQSSIYRLKVQESNLVTFYSTLLPLAAFSFKIQYSIISV